MMKKTLLAFIVLNGIPLITFSAETPAPNIQTFKISAEQLIETYNGLAEKMMGMKKLPLKSAMEMGAENDKSITLQHYVLPNAVISIDIDKQSGKPYAMGVISTSANKAEELDLFNVRSLVGATIFGPSSEAGELEKLCLDIYATGQPGALSKSIKNMTA